MGSFTGLLNNSALMLILCVIYDIFNVHAIGRKMVRDGVTGVLVGLIAIAVMLTPWSLTPGVFFDTRWVLLSLCGLFLGWVPTSIAVVIAGAFRLYQGGAGGVVGTIVIISTACVGLGWRYWKNKTNRPLGVLQLYLFGVLVQLTMLACMGLMPPDMRVPILKAIAPPILIIYPFLTMLLGLVLKRQEDRRATDKQLLQEICDRKLAEDSARESEAHLKTLIETLPDLVWLKDPNGVYLGCNRKFERMMGLEKSDIIGKTDYDLMAAKRADVFSKNDKLAIAAGTPSRSEYETTYADGHTEFVETLKTPMYDLDGSLTGVLGVGRDITARRQSEIEIRKRKEEWERTFNAITDIVLFLDVNLKMIKINQAGRDILGLGDEALIGRYCYQSFHGLDRPCPGCPVVTSAKTAEPQTREMVNERLGKTYIISAAPVFDPDGRLIHLIHVAKDITAQKKLEKELFQAQKMESIGTLAGGIAHDFNNILSAIMGFAELARVKLSSGGNADQDIDQILKASTRAAELVRHILAFSRKSDHRLEPCSPHLPVKEALEMLRASFPATIEIREGIDEHCGKILADPTNIHLIVMNLCTNSLHAMADEKGRIGIKLYQTVVTEDEAAREGDAFAGEFVVLEIQDTGHGMDPATRAHIFDPFFTTKAVGKGTGLGLSVIHGIVQDYHGFIRVESRLGQGSAFYVHFPVFLGQVAEPQVPADIGIPLPSGSERILIVDDEPAIVTLNRNVLERLGYAVTATVRSREALDMIRDNPQAFDLVITDQTMPELTGVEMAREIQALNPDLPIIICTGHRAVISKDDARLRGIKKMITKPIARATLAKAIRQVLDENNDEHRSSSCMG